MKIALKLAIVLLCVALYYVIYIPVGIRQIEKNVYDESREKLTILYEAEKYYKRKTRSFTDNFDTLLTFIKQDTLLQNRIRLVNLTKELVSTVDQYVDKSREEFTSSVFKVSESSGTISNLMDEIRDEYQSTPQIVELADKLYNTIIAANEDDAYLKFNTVKNHIDSIFKVKIDVAEFKLMNASTNLISYSEMVMENMDGMELEEISTLWNGISEDLKTLEELMTAPGMKVQSKTNRFIKQAGIITENIDRLKGKSMAAEKTELQRRHNLFVAARDKFASGENFLLATRYCRPQLDEWEEFISKLDENTIVAPPLNKRYTIALEGRGYKISCPNETGKITHHGVFSQTYRNYGYVTNQGRSWDL